MTRAWLSLIITILLFIIGLRFLIDGRYLFAYINIICGIIKLLITLKFFKEDQ